MMKRIALILALVLAFAPLYHVHAKPVVPYFAVTATSITVNMPPVRTSSIQLVGAVTSGTLAFQSGLGGTCACAMPTHGTLSNLDAATGVILYTPNSGYTGSDSFAFKTTDGAGNFADGTVTINVTSARTTVTGPIIKPDATNVTGTVIFTLTEALTTTAGLIPASSSVTATLSSGTFSVQLYPTSSQTTSATGTTTTSLVNALGRRAYYQVRLKTSASDEILGVFDVPASNTTIALGDLPKLIGVQATTMAFPSMAQFNNLLGKTNGLIIANNGSTVPGGPFSTLDLIPGANISIGTVDNGSGNLGITISDPTGGSGGTVGSATSGQVATYNGATSVTGKAFAGANRILKTNASNTGTEWAAVTAGSAGITITNSVGGIAIDTTALTALNGLSGASQGFASVADACGNVFGISSSGSTHTFCMPSASVTATGTITASAIQQTIAGQKLLTGFDNSNIPLNIQQKVGGSDTLTRWFDSTGYTVGQVSRYGAWQRRLNAGDQAVAPNSAANTLGYVVQIQQDSSDTTTPTSGLLIEQYYTGGAASTNYWGAQTLLNINGTGNQTGTQTAAAWNSLGMGGTGTMTTGVATQSVIAKSASGTLTTGYGFKADSSISAGTITSLFGFYGTAPDVAGGTITNAYGLYLESLTAGSALNYAIYTNAGHSSFGDAVSIRGTSAPAVSAADSGKFYYDSTADLVKLSVNGGAYGNVGTYFEGTATIDFASTAANVCSAASTITVTGAAADRPVWLGVPTAAILSGVVYQAWVSASNTVSVMACNVTTSAKDPASGTFTARVSQ